MARSRFLDDVLPPTLIVIAFISVYIFFAYVAPSLPGSGWDTVSSNIIALWPYFIILALALITLLRVSGGSRR